MGKKNKKCTPGGAAPKSTIPTEPVNGVNEADKATQSKLSSESNVYVNGKSASDGGDADVDVDVDAQDNGGSTKGNGNADVDAQDNGRATKGNGGATAVVNFTASSSSSKKERDKASKQAPPASSKKEKDKASKQAPTPLTLPLPLLNICRNKHWRYISSYHGPWLQLPLEVLECLANSNYYMPKPSPVDPSVFYDLVKIRKLVDCATELAVRAANGINPQPSVPGTASGSGLQHQMHLLGFSYGTRATSMKLSAERRHRLREQATQKLSRAYRVDEIASSVATMQSTSTLENVASLVLQRLPNDPDARYVHFFHEKIPSRQVAESTDVHALDSIISQRPGDCEPLRTRAIVRMFKEDFEGAARDLTTALATYRLNPAHMAVTEESLLMEGRRCEMPLLGECEQPTSTEVQLLFQRAGCFLTLACDNVDGSLQPVTTNAEGNGNDKEAQVDELGNANATDADDAEDAADEKAPTAKQLEHRKRVRYYAKRALRDYVEFVKPLHYSPDLPLVVADDFTRKVNLAHRARRYANQGCRVDTSHHKDGASNHRVYSLSDLFSATPPAELPPYPSTDLAFASVQQPVETTTETVTYHPLLVDALHSLLLCHALVQTSPKELQRHAHMVARLARLTDGYPIFQASRSPARADWVEVIRRAENWIELSSSWETLCAPAPLPPPMSGTNASLSAAAATVLATASTPIPTETEERRKERQRHRAVMEALEDERVNDEPSFKAAVLARQRRAEEDYATSCGNSPTISTQRWAVDDGREYPFLTERAEAVARWVLEAPIGSGASPNTRRKKRPGAAKRYTARRPDASAGASGDVGVGVGVGVGAGVGVCADAGVGAGAGAAVGEDVGGVGATEG